MSQHPRHQGIRTIEINSAREMIAKTVRARQPPSITNTITSTRSTTTTTPTRIPYTQSPPVTSGTESSSSSSLFSTPLSVRVPAEKHNSTQCKNPQCSHCGKVIIPSPASSYPIVETPSIAVGDWEIYTSKQPILNSDEIERETLRLGMTLPEMIFGNNKVEIRKGDFKINFNTLDALDLVDTTGDNILKVSYTNEWLSTRRGHTEEITDVLKPFDWTYTTNYKGSTNYDWEEGGEIPIEKLKRPDPILFFDDLVLYEDELGDNGISLLNVKIRVMPERLLLLSRFFLRVDNVIFRIRDTRVYVDFTSNEVIREYKEQEGSYEDVSKKIQSSSGDPRSFLRDQNWISSKLPVVFKQTHHLQL